MQWLITAIVAAFLLIPGVEILRLILVGWTGLYEELNLRDACLIYIVILQVAILVQLVVWQRELQWARMAQMQPQARPRRSAMVERPAAGRGASGSPQRRSSTTRSSSSQSRRSRRTQR